MGEMHRAIAREEQDRRRQDKVVGAMAEFERALTQERVRAGMRLAKSKGKRLGRLRAGVYHPLPGAQGNRQGSPLRGHGDGLPTPVPATAAAGKSGAEAALCVTQSHRPDADNSKSEIPDRTGVCPVVTSRASGSFPGITRARGESVCMAKSRIPRMRLAHSNRSLSCAALRRNSSGFRIFVPGLVQRREVLRFSGQRNS